MNAVKAKAMAVVLSVAGLVGCSFTTATGFDECKSDLDCAASSVCSKHYCLPMAQGCQRVEGVFDAGERIPMAAVLPLSSADGGVSERETYRLDAMRLAIIGANKLGGVKNRPFALYVCNGSSNDVVQAQTNWLITNLQVPAIVVSGSDRLLAAESEPSRLAAGTFMISPNATSAGLISSFQTHGNVWRVAPPDTLQAKVLAQTFIGDGGMSDGGTSDGGTGLNAQIVVLAEDSFYGGALKLALVTELTNAGFTKVEQLSFSAGLSATGPLSATSYVNTLDNKQPVATFFIGFPADVAQVMSAASTHPRLQLANGHRWFLSDSAKDPSILSDSTRPVLEGVKGTAPAQGSGAAYLGFTSEFNQIFKVDANAYSFIAHSSDAMWLTLASAAWAAQDDAGITGPRMRDGISHMMGPGAKTPLVGAKWNDVAPLLVEGRSIDVEGSSGTLQFDLDAGAPSSPYEIWSVVDGGIVTLGYVTP